MDIELNDTIDIRHDLISLVENYYEYNDRVSMDDVIQCLYDYGYLTYRYDDDDALKMSDDRTLIDEWGSLHDMRALDLYHGSFMMFIILHLLNYNKSMVFIMNNHFWRFITKNITL